MVLKGQFLERPTLIPTVGGWVLEGMSHRGHRRPLVLVIPQPPAQGSGMDHVVGAEVAFAVSRAGHPCLRFNFRGVGGSQGPLSRSPDDWLDDVLAALVVARENGVSRDVLAVSLGASDALLGRLASVEPLAGAAFISPSFLSPADVARLPVDLPVALVLPELERAGDRAGLSEALQARGGVLEVVPGATSAYQRNLPLVGKAVASLAHQAGELGARPGAD